LPGKRRLGNTRRLQKFFLQDLARMKGIAWLSHIINSLNGSPPLQPQRHCHSASETRPAIAR
jgi:hypothetical protein